MDSIFVFTVRSRFQHPRSLGIQHCVLNFPQMTSATVARYMAIQDDTEL